MLISSQKFIGGQEVKPGLRLSSPAVGLTFSITRVCDSVSPETWHGEVLFANRVLLRTGTFDDDHKAFRAAEDLLAEKVLELFSR